MAMAGPNTTVYAAAGRTVIPGLNETHVHPTLAARSECTLPFRQLGSIEEIKSWVRDRVAETPEAAWVVLPRIDVTRIREGRMPDRADLDAARQTDRPRSSGGMRTGKCKCSTPQPSDALGIGRDTVVPDGGRIVMDQRGEPTGRIENAVAHGHMAAASGTIPRRLPRRSPRSSPAVQSAWHYERDRPQDRR